MATFSVRVNRCAGGTFSRRRSTTSLSNSAFISWGGPEKNDDVLASVELPVEPLPGGSAVGIEQDSRAFDDVGLLGIVCGHLPAARGEAFFEGANDFRVAAEADTQCLSYGFAGEVVFGGAEPATEDHDVGAKQGVLRGGDQAAEIITHNRFE